MKCLAFIERNMTNYQMSMHAVSSVNLLTSMKYKFKCFMKRRLFVFFFSFYIQGPKFKYDLE